MSALGHSVPSWAATDRYDWLEATAGPAMLHAAVGVYRAAGGSGLTLLSPGCIYSVNSLDNKRSVRCSVALLA